jgi:hypothetical protein
MSQENARQKIAKGLVTAACLACIGFGIGDMLEALWQAAGYARDQRVRRYVKPLS